MISSKYFSKIAIVLTCAVLILCVLAIGFSDKLASLVGKKGYALEYEEALFNTDKILDIDISVNLRYWK